jgi:hypothetical protein
VCHRPAAVPSRQRGVHHIEAAGALINLIYVWTADAGVFRDTLTPRREEQFGMAPIVQGDTLMWQADMLRLRMIVPFVTT